MDKIKLYLVLIFICAFLIRIYGLDWDSSQHLHPDERFLTMVTTDIHLPKNILNYFDTKTSPLNPYNNPQYNFFVYGTFPLFLVKFISVALNMDDYNKIHLVGRFLSALLHAVHTHCAGFVH